MPAENNSYYASICRESGAVERAVTITKVPVGTGTNEIPVPVGFFSISEEK
jgi:hypothetical protein